MPTKDQYEFFKQAYLEEDVRSSLLVKRGEIYLSLISLFLTGLVFKFSDLKGYIQGNLVSRAFYSLIIVSLFLSAIFAMLSLQIRRYRGINLSGWIDELEDDAQTDKEFYINRIADFIALTITHQKINNKRGRQLKLAGYFLLGAILFIGILLLTLTI